MSKIFRVSGGYRKLNSFNFSVIIHLATTDFCKRFIPWQEDTLGKRVGQMIGASRSGKQNIIEGSERAKTSAETEMKLTDVAKASLCELQGDFEDYLIEQNSIPWSIYDDNHKELSTINLAPFEYTEDILHDYWKYLLAEKRKFARWLESDDAIIVANALIVLIHRTVGMLGRQLERLEDDFIRQGGIKERMYSARVEARNEKEEHDDSASPACPECNRPMRKRNSARGCFWGCSNFPECRGTRPIEDKPE